MTFDEFKTNALRTEKPMTDLNFSRVGLFTLLLAAAQMAKIVDTAKKTIVYGKLLDVSKFQEQLFQVTRAISELGQNASMVSQPGVLEEDDELFQPNLRIMHGAIGMFGEAGELLDAVLKEMKTGALDLVNVGEELGDNFWYAAIIADETGISFDSAQETVVKKLKARFGDKFTSEAALSRDLATERSILEASISVPASV